VQPGLTSVTEGDPANGLPGVRGRDLTSLTSASADGSGLPPGGCPASDTGCAVLGDGIWGEGRVRTVYQVALMSYTAALDDVLAMAAGISGGMRTAIPAVVLARAVAEVCSRPGGCSSQESAPAGGWNVFSVSGSAALWRVSGRPRPTGSTRRTGTSTRSGGNLCTSTRQARTR
jgi:hypothetical protein